MSTPGVNLSKVPLVPNPSGAPPNFVNSPSLEFAFMGVGISLIIISTILLAIRLIANYKHTSRLWLDDYLCIIAWLSSVAYWALFRTLVADGTAHHSWDVPMSIMTTSYKNRIHYQQVAGSFSMWVVKACILTLFIRIFDSVRWMRITSYTLLISLGLFYLGSIAVFTAYRAPHLGDNWLATGLLAMGVVGLVSDIVMFILPFPIIMRLNLRTPSKLGLMVVFAVAISTVVASCASLAYRIVAYKSGKRDPTWLGMNMAITSNAEQFGTVIVSCAPGLTSFWCNIFMKSRIYSIIRSRILHRSPDTSDKQYGEDIDLHRYTPTQHQANMKTKTRDPYRVTELDLQSQASINESCSERSNTGLNGFITNTFHEQIRTRPGSPKIHYKTP